MLNLSGGNVHIDLLQMHCVVMEKRGRIRISLIKLILHSSRAGLPRGPKIDDAVRSGSYGLFAEEEL